MKELFGFPGKVSGLMLRLTQCVFASASIGVMASASGFSSTTAFCYLIASMGLQVLWSFGLACFDIHALRLKKDLRHHVCVGLFAVGDWVTAVLSLGACCSSAGVIVLFAHDTDICKVETKLGCDNFQISIALAFTAWLFLVQSCYVMFRLLASV